MYSKRFLLSLVAGVSLLMVAGCKPSNDTGTAPSAGSPDTAALPGQSTVALPDLELTALDGSPVTLSSYTGQPVVLNLWATWCPPCRREMPALQQAQKEFSDVAFVLVNQGEGAQKAQEFLDSEGLSFTDIVLDPSSETMRALKTGGLPTTFFFDAQGRLADLHLGEITLPQIKEKISNSY